MKCDVGWPGKGGLTGKETLETLEKVGAGVSMEATVREGLQVPVIIAGVG